MFVLRMKIGYQNVRFDIKDAQKAISMMEVLSNTAKLDDRCDRMPEIWVEYDPEEAEEEEEEQDG